ncbi:ATP-binding cassette domain-containing protein [Vannielia litorea]|uniref:ATP-binding cassette domain-containing protein n=1 Tax=Vannielia litorea TaxID=1217970 RepID=UPI0021BDDE6D|nr:ATP-binding cassette domain-containing protein [Vannielia litorea]
MTAPRTSLKLKMSRAGIRGVVGGRQGAAPAEAVAAPVAELEAAPRGNSERLKARADLAATYAGLLGKELLGRDIAEDIARSGGAERPVTVEALAGALSQAGMLAAIRREAEPSPATWPAIAQMKRGQLVLVLSQQGEELTVYDETGADNRVVVPLTEFAPHYAGRVLKAEVTLAEVAAAHETGAKKPHWFWGEFPRFRRYIAEIAIGSLVANLLAVSVALFSLQVYDRVIPHQSMATLWVLALGAGLAILLEGLLKVARSRLMDGGGRTIELSVQRLLMSRVVGMRSDKRAQSPSELFATMREFGSVREFFTAGTIGTLTDLPFIGLFLLLVAAIAGPVVWVLIIGGALMVLPGWFMQRRMMQLTQETQGANVKAGRVLHEAVYELDTIKAQRGEERLMRAWDELNALSSLKSSEQRRLAAALTFWSQGVQQATYVAAVVMGTFLVFAGEFTVGTIIAVGILTSRTLAPLSQLAATLSRWSNVRHALAGLDGVAEAPQDVAEGRKYLRREHLKGSYTLLGTRFAYDEDAAPVLDISALQVRAGETLAVLGSNGSGKSTLMKLLTGLYAPTEGRVMLDGTDIGQIAPADLRRGIGYLAQDVRLVAGTLRDNLNMHLLERDDDRLLAALDFAGLGQFVRSHPKGLDLDIRDGGEGLSVGQRQGVGWARLWLQDPGVLLLDEPTAAFDQALEAQLVARLGAWLQGRTAVIATHRLPILSLSSRIVVLGQGRIAVDGGKDEVLAHLKKSGAAKKLPLGGAA